ncbi:hypothetical protein FACS189459_7210 [Bacilli bacterium]|nr:hypothetical protein FACS189459_7210 [Bacilli bacterium]
MGISIKTDGVKGIGKNGIVYCSDIDTENNNLTSVINNYGTQEQSWGLNDLWTTVEPTP